MSLILKIAPPFNFANSAAVFSCGFLHRNQLRYSWSVTSADDYMNLEIESLIGVCIITLHTILRKM